jgi:hypothetical protein
LKTWDTEEGSINLSGTFFCDSTTAQSFPRTPTEVMFAAVMALNAYSVQSVSSCSAKVSILSYPTRRILMCSTCSTTSRTVMKIQKETYRLDIIFPDLRRW